MGLIGIPLLPTAFAVGCTLTPLRGYGFTVLFHHLVEILVLTHTLKLRPFKSKRRLADFSALLCGGGVDGGLGEQDFDDQ
jgi:hypothetical protein